MVLILSIPTDLSTVHVLEWFDAWGVPWVRINPNELLGLVKFQIDPTGTIEFELMMEDGRLVKSREISAYWYRRGDLSFKCTDSEIKEHWVPLEMQNHFNWEIGTLVCALHTSLQGVRHLNGRLDNETNKLDNLVSAARHGLRVPRTLVTSSYKELGAFFNACAPIVTKGIHSGFFFQEDGIDYEGFTRRVTVEEVHRLANNFHPTLFQEEIPKNYEIRSFFLAGSFYSMAIFSQSNKQTEVDFRNYDRLKPNRTVPFRLPEQIEVQLAGFMADLNMHSGSLDLIRAVDGSYVFLEVNPIGQFGQVSIPCNYALEMLVAQYLCHDTRKHEDVPH